MVTIQLIISNDNGTSSTSNGNTIDPEVIAAAVTIATALTAAASGTDQGGAAK